LKEGQGKLRTTENLKEKGKGKRDRKQEENKVTRKKLSHTKICAFLFSSDTVHL
jgi:hypothetical protein